MTTRLLGASVLAAAWVLQGYADASSTPSGFVYPFCTEGISPSQANFSDEPVEVIFAQAPLFSNNLKIGQKGKYLNLYHSCLVLAQGAGASRRYWTLEFDYTGGNLLQSLTPEFKSNPETGLPMVWHNDARYCLTEGVLWGEKHWSKTFRILFAVTPAQMRQAFTDFIGTVNSTVPDTKPQYQLWRVAKRWPDTEMLVQDTTCADGAVWFLNHFTSTQNVMLPQDFEFRATVVKINADHVTAIDTSDKSQVDNMVAYYKLAADVINSNATMEERLFDVLELALGGRKYVYDSNSKVYYELKGNKFPWVSFVYAQYSIMGPPWMQPNTSTLIV
jgi:hypothetical protein